MLLSMSPLHSARLYGILDLGCVAADDALCMGEKLIAGGVDVVQLRAKKLPADAFLALAQKLAPIFRSAGIPFILNDHPELVQAAGADGAHVGQDDISVAQARRLAGAGAIIGKSTHSTAQALAGMQEADYIGFGPLFPTPTKPDYTAIGLAEIAQVQQVSPVPVFCIGGIKLENLTPVLDAGARRVVIVSGILNAPDPADYIRRVKARL